MTEQRASLGQQVIVQVIAAGLAGFLGTYVGVEVVKERVQNFSGRIDKVESRVEKLEQIQTTILSAQVQTLTHQIEEWKAGKAK